MKIKAEGARSLLDPADILIVERSAHERGIRETAQPLQARHRLPEKLHALCVQPGSDRGQPGDVAIGVRQAGRQAKRNGVPDGGGDDGHRPAHRLDRLRGRPA